MVVIYGCSTGAHASVVAAGLHLGWLDPERFPGRQELENLPHFDSGENPGLFFMGADKAGRRVYTAAVDGEGRLVSKLIFSFLEVLGRLPSEVTFIDLASREPFILRFGSLLRRSGWGRGIGLRLIIWGLRAYYPRLVSSLT
ncbi:MAG: hypothetical protein PWP65_1201 [Clostridia bacterium]|nr:hypothetical protein [Clostridia bacterium]